MPNTWDPDRYHAYREERSRPFADLLAGVVNRRVSSACDLGCGTGEGTGELHRTLRCDRTLGVDSSAEMLSRTPQTTGELAGLEFVRADLESWEPPKPFDLVFSNACLHWLPDHRALLTRIAEWVAPGGELAVQVPANHDHPSQTLAATLARDPEFADDFEGWVRRTPVLTPSEYAQHLDQLGFRRQRVEARVYDHRVDGSDGVLNWVRGTTLLDYEKRVAPPTFERFLTRYRERLAERFGDGPVFFPFQRILFWAGERAC